MNKANYNVDTFAFSLFISPFLVVGLSLLSAVIKVDYPYEKWK